MDDLKPCPVCAGERRVCENHPNTPWNAEGCECGAGAPCPMCNEKSAYGAAILACPFCGESARVEEWGDDMGAHDFAGVRCGCGAVIFGEVHWYGHDLAEVRGRAIVKWNTRTAPTRHDPQIQE